MYLLDTGIPRAIEILKTVISSSHNHHLLITNPETMVFINELRGARELLLCTVLVSYLGLHMSLNDTNDD